MASKLHKWVISQARLIVETGADDKPIDFRADSVKPDTRVLTVRGSAITKDGEATDGKSIALTAAHLRDASTVIRDNRKANGSVTIERMVVSNGRKADAGMEADAFSAWLTGKPTA